MDEFWLTVSGGWKGVRMSEGLSEQLHHRTFPNRTLRASRFISCDFVDVVVRGSDIAGMELDFPWVLEVAAVCWSTASTSCRWSMRN